jgi:hypothetical protein
MDMQNLKLNARTSLDDLPNVYIKEIIDVV